MSHKITLITHDSHEIEFTSEDNQTIQDAAESANYFPPFGCKSGICGVCLGTCKTGDYQLDSYSPSVLTPEDAANGGILLCRTIAQSDLTITLPYNAELIQRANIAPRDAEILSITPIADRTIQLVLQLKEDPELGLAFDFEPGQFVELEIPGTDLMRAYSLSNTANWEGRLEFLIRLQPNGKFSEYIQSAEIGQHLLVHAASGAFVVNKQSSNPRCFIAGGTGVAPFISILKRMAEWSEDHPTHLFLGVNNEAEILCLDELKALQQSLAQFTLEVCVWRPETDWQGFIGTPVDAFKAYLNEHGAGYDVYLCGPPILVEAATNTALEAGIEKDNIYSERFVAS